MMRKILMPIEKDIWREITPVGIRVLKEGYKKNYLLPDFVAGLTVAIVALPLAMAFSIAAGLEPQRGLFTAIVAGVLTAFFGGSRVQIGGPTGAFVVIISGVVAQHGYQGLALATLMAGVILVAMGFLRLGSVIKFIPYPVITGFTAGIALIIFTSQIKDFLGLPLESVPADFISKWIVFAQNITQISGASFAIGSLTILVIVLATRYIPRLPGPIVAIAVSLFVVYAFGWQVETIESRFGKIPSSLPAPALPVFDWAAMKAVTSDAFTIALLAAIESLLCAVVADGMTGNRHSSNAELVGQGLGNLGSVLFAGIPSTGAIARTATAIRAGAKTPLAAIFHAGFLYLFMFLLAPLIGQVPLATLAGILMVVAWNMSEMKHFKRIFLAPMSDVVVLLLTFALTVLVDLTVAVQVGVALAGILFIKRIAQITEIAPHQNSVSLEGDDEYDDDPDATSRKEILPGIEVYEINGPFFFGVASKLKDILDQIEKKPVVFILRMRRVPVIDATGMHALREFQKSCQDRGTVLLLSGVEKKLASSLDKFGFLKELGKGNVFSHIDLALKKAEEILNEKENEH